MDTTLQYAKMCRKAQDIQELWARDDGDFYLETAGPMPALHGVYVWRKGETNEKAIHERVWMPRQDQLQNMVVCSNNAENVRYHEIAYFILQDFADWFQSCEHCEDMMKLDSREKMTLCWVMHVVYSKVWDGCGWVDA